MAALPCATATVRPLVVVKDCRHTGKENSLHGCGAALMAIVFPEFLKTEPVRHACPGCHNHASKLTGPDTALPLCLL